MTAQLSPEQVRSLLSDPSSLVGEGPSMTTGKPHRVYLVTWDRCAVCKEREQGLAGIRVPGRFPKIVYVCEQCRKELSDDETEPERLDGQGGQAVARGHDEPVQEVLTW
jgi:uncharacterized protein (DUF983 family)